MKRYLPSSRTRSNIVTTNALRDQFIRDFTLQAQSILKDLTTQFTDTLQTQASQVLQNQAGASDNAVNNLNSTGAAGSVGAISSLLSTGVRYLVSRPHTSKDSAETSRSIDAAQFRVSKSQSAAEMQQMLTKGDKNL